MSWFGLVFELLDDFLYVAAGALVYSYTRHWFGTWRPFDVGARTVVNGLAFGALAAALMWQGIPVTPGVLVDARSVPLALIALFDGWPPAVLAAAVAAVFRLALGGTGAVGGIAIIGVAAAAGALVHEWARRDGRIGARHALTLAGLVFLAEAGRFLLLGAAGVPVLRRVWLSYLLLAVGGIGLMARLFHDVLERERATELRAVALLANAAAHEINNPLTALMGSLELLSERMPKGGREAGLLERAFGAGERIKEIVHRMNRITHVERLPGQIGLPDILDIKRSSAQ
jgi:signal transduction histidine kinase